MNFTKEEKETIFTGISRLIDNAAENMGKDIFYELPTLEKDIDLRELIERKTWIIKARKNQELLQKIKEWIKEGEQ